MRNKIKEWLADPDKSYLSGLALFNETKHSTQYDKFFALNNKPDPSSLPFKMLIQQLQNALRKIEQYPEEPVKLEGAKPIGTPSLKTKATQKQSVKILTEIDLKNLPEDLQANYNRTKEIVPEMNAVQQEMRDATTDEDRQNKAETLCNLEDEKDASWKAIDDFVAKTDVVEVVKEADPVALALAKNRRIENLKIYIGRENKRIEAGKVNESIMPGVVKKIDDWKKELSELEK